MLLERNLLNYKWWKRIKHQIIVREGAPDESDARLDVLRGVHEGERADGEAAFGVELHGGGRQEAVAADRPRGTHGPVSAALPQHALHALFALARERHTCTPERPSHAH